MTIEGTTEATILDLLEQDRTWSAYALADMDPQYASHAHWYATDSTAALVYEGLQPPVLFITGNPGSVAEILTRLPPGPVQFTLRAVHKSLIAERLVVTKQVRMWRMALETRKFNPTGHTGVARLGSDDLPAVEDLIASGPDHPDAFAPDQLDSGVFFGSYDGDRLLSMAGTHVLSRQMDVAAIGNVYTSPSARGRGLAKAVSSAVIAELIAMDIDTIVLNVAMDNGPALRVYESLGFHPYCGYYEGMGELKPLPTTSQSAMEKP